mgnify:CR=1 FL=1
MSHLRISHVPTYDRLGVRVSPLEQITVDVSRDGITIGIGADPLTRREFALTEGEALRLADWIYNRTRGVNRLG